MNLEEIFKDKSESTKKNYIQRINRLKKLYFPDDNDYKFIKKPNRLIKKINGSDYPASTKRDYYIALYAVNPNEKYKNEMYKFRDETNKKQGESTISEEKLINYDTMKNLKKILDIMPEDTYTQVRDKLLISIYLLKPPIRNDLESVAVFKKDKVLDPNIKDSFNYIQKKENEFIFYLNQYKTVKKYGAKKIIYSKSEDPQIYNLFKKIIKFNKPFLIVNDNNNNNLDDKQISALIIKIFENYLNKHVSINTIRHIYETELINSEEYKKMSMTQKKALHNELMHDFTTAHTDYNKINMPIQTNLEPEQEKPIQTNVPIIKKRKKAKKIFKLNLSDLDINKIEEELYKNEPIIKYDINKEEKPLIPKKKIIKKVDNYEVQTNLKPKKSKKSSIEYIDINEEEEIKPKKPSIKIKTVPLIVKYINFDDLTLPELKQLVIDYNNKFIIKITKTENEKQVLKNKAELLKDIKYFLKVDDKNKIVSQCLDLELNLNTDIKNIKTDKEVIKTTKKIIKIIEKQLELNPDNEEAQQNLIQQQEILKLLENKIEEKPTKKEKIIKEKVDKVEKPKKEESIPQNEEIENNIKQLKEFIKQAEKNLIKIPNSTILINDIKMYKTEIENLKKNLKK
jgi:hypothetical protein